MSQAVQAVVPVERIAFLDVARGLGILLVVIGHNPFILDNPTRFNFVFSFHLPLFLFLSGWLLAPDYPWGRQLARRANGLLKPYFLTLGMLAVLQWALHSRAPDILFAGIIYGTGATITWIPLWYLPHLWLVTLSAVPIARALTTLASPKWLISAILALMLTLGVYVMRAISVPLGDYGLPWSADLIGISLFFLLLGWLARDALLASHIRPLTGLLCLVALLALLAWQPASMDLNLRRYDHLLWSTLAALLGITASLALARQLASRVQLTRMLGYIGQGTIFILIFHAPVQFRVITWLDTHASGPQAVHNWVGFIAAVALPLLGWQIVRRNRWLSTLMLASPRSSPRTP